MAKFVKINGLITDKISGEWGIEVNGEPGVNVLRTTNFTNQGGLNIQSVVKRKIKADLIAKKKLAKGDVIIEKSGGSPTQPVGRVVYFDLEGEDYLCNNFTAVLRPSKDVFPKYFFYALYFLHLSKRTLKYQNKTTGILNLKLERYLEEEQIKVPDLPTQKQIAHLLDEADIARQKRKAANALTDQFLHSTFLSMFGDPATNSTSWPKTSLRSLSVQYSDGPFGSNLKSEHYTSSGILVIRLENIGVNEFKDSSLSYVSEEHYKKLEKHTCLSGDVIIGTMGEPNLRACILPNYVRIAINKADCVLFRPNKQMVLSEYISHLLNNKSFVTSVSNLVLGQTRGRISMGRLGPVEIPVPPLSLQQKFASIVADTEQLRQKQKQSEIELENLFQALLQKYFG